VALRTSSGSRRRFVAVQLDQVEGVEEDASLVAAVADAIEARHLSSQATALAPAPNLALRGLSDRR
jgi:hypothetical protein